MSHRNRSINTEIDSDELPESPPTSRHFQRRTTTLGTTPVVPRGQDRPRISVERSRSENRIRRDLQFGSSSDPEETSPIYLPVASTRLPNPLPVLPSTVPCRTPSSLSISRSTPATTPLSHVNATCRASCCDHERQFDALQRKLAVLTEKIDNLQGQRSAPAMGEKRKSKNLPRDMVACVHKVVGKLKEKDPPTQWRFEPDHSLNDDTNLEVTEGIERGVRATSAFKEADPVLLERAIKTYFKTLKAKSKRLLTRVRNEGLPQVANKQDESVINSRRNQRGHNKLKSRRVALRQSSYTEAKKRRLEEVISIEYMSPEESEYESNEEGGERTMNKLVIRRFEWRSEELTREFQSLDRKANRARSERGRRMMVKREEGGFLPNTLHCYPKYAPAWALCEQLQAEPNIRSS